MSQEDLTARRRFANRYEESLAHLEEGLARLEAGDVTGAIEKLETALRYDRENTLAHGNLGLIYRQLGQLEKAEDAYRVALDLEPADPWLHRGLAAVYLQAAQQLRQTSDRTALVRMRVPAVERERRDTRAVIRRHQLRGALRRKAHRADAARARLRLHIVAERRLVDLQAL